MNNITYRLGIATLAILAVFTGAKAQTDQDARPAYQLPSVEVTAARTTAQQYQLPNTVESNTAAHIAQSVNIMDTPDALKYMPSLMVRKRDSADYGGATLATRIWGVSYSAKSIVTVDGMPISTQLYNDNNYGPPKWFVVSPDEIERVDVMYGPYSAAYSGNSVGAVVDISTRRPSKEFEGSVGATQAVQTFKLYGTSDSYQSTQFSGLLGGKGQSMTWRVFANHEDANTQPRTFGYSTTAGVSPYPYVLKDGTTGNYYDGAATLLHGVSDNANVRLSFDLTADVQLNLIAGILDTNTDSHSQSYLTGGTFCPTTSPCNTLATGVYNYKQEQYISGLGLKSLSNGRWDYDFNLSNFIYYRDLQRTAGYLNANGSVVNGVSGKAGTIADLSGSGWSNVDAKWIFRPDGTSGSQIYSFGYHQDYNKLNSRKVNAINWQGADISDPTNTLATLTTGISETKALWAQDAIRLSDSSRVTLGGRYEFWGTRDGTLYSSSAPSLGTQSLNAVNAEHFSPKLAFQLDLNSESTVGLSIANAMRFPTLGELYNVASCSSSSGCASTQYLIVPPNSIKPEDVDSVELSYSLQHGTKNFRVSLFYEETRNALITQYGNLSDPNPAHFYSYWLNVNKVRSNGLELAYDAQHFIWDAFDINGSLTLVDSKIADDSGFTYAGTTRVSATGNLTPGVSPVRAKFLLAYHPDSKSTISLGGNYLQQFYSSLANNDVYANTYQGFAGYFVMDVKYQYKPDQHWVLSAGIDNLNNQQYFFYHPFPQTTFVGNLKYNF